MKFGLFANDILGSNMEELKETAQTVEASGFDGLFVGENHFPLEGVPKEAQGGFPLTSAPLALCAVLAAHTNRIQVGPSVMALPLHDPIEVAKEVALVDSLSEGRMVLGVGIGSSINNGFAEYGIPYKQRVSRFEEGFEVMRKAWKGERFSHSGKYHQIENGILNHTPTQGENQTVWVGAQSIPGIRRAARLGNALVLDPFGPMQYMKDLISAYREECAAVGTEPFVVATRAVCIGETTEAARARYEGPIVGRTALFWAEGYMDPKYDPWAGEISSPDEVTWEMGVNNRIIWGDPQTCADEISRWKAELDCDYILIDIPLSGAGRSGLIEDIRLIGSIIK